MWIDPGVGFGKSLAQSLTLLARLDELVAAGFPVAVATSRKTVRGCAPRVRQTRGPPRPALPGLVTSSLVDAVDESVMTAADDRVEGSLATAMYHVGARRLARSRARRSGDGERGAAAHGRGRRMSRMKGKWAQGIKPRNFAWIIRDRLAICERPGGYGANHRRVRRQEEIIWLREQGFTRVISLIPSPHNLHNYEELGCRTCTGPSARTTRAPRCSASCIPR